MRTLLTVLFLAILSLVRLSGVASAQSQTIYLATVVVEAFTEKRPVTQIQSAQIRQGAQTHTINLPLVLNGLVPTGEVVGLLQPRPIPRPITQPPPDVSYVGDPAAPILLQPPAGHTTSHRAFTFAWEIGQGSPVPTSFRLCIVEEGKACKDPIAATYMIDASTRSYNPPGGLPLHLQGKRLEWSMAACAPNPQQPAFGGGYEESCTYAGMRSLLWRLPAPTLMPVEQSNPFHPVFRWEAVSGADTYFFCISKPDVACPHQTANTLDTLVVERQGGASATYLVQDERDLHRFAGQTVHWTAASCNVTFGCIYQQQIQSITFPALSTPPEWGDNSRVVLEDPGTIMVREGFQCADSTTSPLEPVPYVYGGGTEFQRDKEPSADIVLDARESLPEYATQATVFLNGWRLLYIDESASCTASHSDESCYAWLTSRPAIDHHVRSAKLAILNIRQADDRLQWEVRGHLSDENGDAAFGLCYHYTTLAWNDRLLDLQAKHDDGQSGYVQLEDSNHVRIVHRDEDTALLHKATQTEVPNANLDSPIAILPRGYRLHWDNKCDGCILPMFMPVEDYPLLQMAYKVEHRPYEATSDGRTIRDTYSVLKDEDVAHDYWLDEWVSVLSGTDLTFSQQPFNLSPRAEPNADGCIAAGHGTFQTQSYTVSDLPYEYAIPVLSGWDLWYPCGDEHVGEVGVWLHDIEYDKRPFAATSTLRYKVTTVLRDEDSRPDHHAGYVVNILGLDNPQPATQDLYFRNAIVGFLSMAPEWPGQIRNRADIPLVITQVDESGIHPNEFSMYELEHGGIVYSVEEITPQSPLTLQPGNDLYVTARFSPGAEAPEFAAPRSAFLQFHTTDARWPTVRLDFSGHTVPDQADGGFFPGILQFGDVYRNASNHPSGFPTRNAVIVSHGPTPLLIQSLALADANQGFSFGVLEAPIGNGNVRGVGQFQIDPGDSLLLQIRFMPVATGPVQTKLIAETNAGRLELQLAGYGVGP